MMNKYVIYHPDNDTYLFCGHGVHSINERDLYVNDVNEATIFHSLEEVDEFLRDFEYDSPMKILSVEMDITPDFRFDHYKTIDAMREQAELEEQLRVKQAELEAEQRRKSVKKNMRSPISTSPINKRRKIKTSEVQKQIEEIQEIIDGSKYDQNVKKKQEYSIKRNKDVASSDRDVFNPLDSDFV